jgi:nucleoside-diphosphate-sugar epimerase
LDEGLDCVSIDVQPDWASHPRLRSVEGDITDRAVLERLFSEHRFDAVVHCAALLAHAADDKDALWRSNVDGTCSTPPRSRPSWDGCHGDQRADAGPGLQEL